MPDALPNIRPMSPIRPIAPSASNQEPTTRNYEPLLPADLVNLGPWLERCRVANVPFIKAEFSEPFPIEQIYNCLDGPSDDDITAITEALNWARRVIKDRTAMGEPVMFRWECGTGGRLKHHLAHGRGWNDPCSMFSQPGKPVNPFHMINVDDPRLLDIMVGIDQRVCIRPFIQPLIYDGYPVEFRVFYDVDGDVGISNYYPQRAIPVWLLSNGISSSLTVTVCNHALNLYQSNGGKAAFPMGFTADFLVTTDRHVVFLEGGPPHHEGYISAHPCCFAPGKINGIALSKQPGALNA